MLTRFSFNCSVLVVAPQFQPKASLTVCQEASPLCHFLLCARRRPPLPFFTVIGAPFPLVVRGSIWTEDIVNVVTEDGPLIYQGIAWMVLLAHSNKIVHEYLHLFQWALVSQWLV